MHAICSELLFDISSMVETNVFISSEVYKRDSQLYPNKNVDYELFEYRRIFVSFSGLSKTLSSVYE